MTEKEMNTAILEQLYNIAQDVWSLMEKHIDGSFTAKEVRKHIGKELKWGENDKTKNYEVNVGTYHCKFPTCQVFNIVVGFENLTSIGNKQRLFVTEKKGDEVGSVTFYAYKRLREICSFAANKHTEQPTYQYIFIDTEKNCLVATTGKKLMVQPITITEEVGDTSNMFINVQDFKKMCAKIKGKKVYNITARKEKVHSDYITKVEFENVLSSVKNDFCFLKYSTLFEKRSRELNVSIINWQSVRKFAKTKDTAFIGFKGKQGDNFVVFETDSAKIKVLTCGNIKHSFSLLLAKDDILATGQVGAMNLFIGKDSNCTIQAYDDKGTLYLFIPGRSEKGTYVGEYIDNTLIAPKVECNVDLLQLFSPINETNLREKAASIRMKKNTKKAHQKAEGKGKNKHKKNHRKFTFAKVGLNYGDYITFVDGKEVKIVSDTEISWIGDIFTLSGFCKKFMPEERKTPQGK